MTREFAACTTASSHTFMFDHALFAGSGSLTCRRAHVCTDARAGAAVYCCSCWRNWNFNSDSERRRALANATNITLASAPANHARIFTSAGRCENTPAFTTLAAGNALTVVPKAAPTKEPTVSQRQRRLAIMSPPGRQGWSPRTQSGSHDADRAQRAGCSARRAQGS